MALVDLSVMLVAVPVLYIFAFSLVRFLLTGHSAEIMKIANYVAGDWEDKHIVWGSVCVTWLLATLSFHPVLYYTAWVCSPGQLDNENPRKQKDKLTGLGARMWSGHKNAHEAFPGFLAAICCLTAFGVPHARVAPACVLFVLARFTFHFMFALNVSLLRSFAFSTGAVINALLFVRALAPSMVPWLK